MNNTNLGNVSALKEYVKINIQTGIENASPHRLIQMLIDGVLAKLAEAKVNIKMNATAKKGEDISMAISIIGGLRDSLDHDKGGSITNNLEDLYEYMTYKLMEANLKNDISLIDEVHDLLIEIKTAWDGISDHANQFTDEQKQIEPAA